MSRHPYVTKYSDNRARDAVRVFDQYEARPSSYMQTIRPTLSGGNSGPLTTGYALVKSLASTTNFNGVAGPIIYDQASTEETRLYVAVSNLTNSVFTTAQFDFLTAVAPPAFGVATLRVYQVNVAFDVSSMTWATQPDVTNPLIVPVAATEFVKPVYQLNLTLTQGTIPTFTELLLLHSAATAKGFLFMFEHAASFGRTTVNLISNLNFYSYADLS